MTHDDAEDLLLMGNTTFNYTNTIINQLERRIKNSCIAHITRDELIEVHVGR
jgi:hypothetical protein